MSDEFNRTAPPIWGPLYRDEAWRRLGSEQFDIVVVGGGVVECGCRTRRRHPWLQVALVDPRHRLRNVEPVVENVPRGLRWNSSNWFVP